MRDPEALPVMESFYTIQGEGAFVGTAAHFLRLGGCDVGCKWCDVKESWSADDHPWIAIDEILPEIVKSKVNLAVITGGEPMLYNLTKLTKLLKQQKIRTNVETSGTSKISGAWDWICFSPKKFKRPLQEYYDQADELKIVIFHKSDFAWAERHAAKMHKDAALYLQPEWSKENEITPLIVEYVKKHPKWKISIQTHKYMQIP
ncbi:MAG: 7-carboxy-7-deazaguanine synthase QueE [Bacteroidota bacterium]